MNVKSGMKDLAPLGYLVFEVSKLIKRRFEEAAREHGVTLPQWRALAQIAANDQISQASLAGLIDADPMTVSGILDRLEKRGLIERFADPEDSRAKRARITPAGIEQTLVARRIGLERFESAIEGLTAEQQSVMIAGLTRMRDNLSGPVAAYEDSSK